MGFFSSARNDGAGADKGGKSTTPPMKPVKSKYPPKKTLSPKPSKGKK